jgi:hypothetical protein
VPSVVRFSLFHRDRSPWANGICVALLNGMLAIGCFVTFFGTLGVVTEINARYLARHGNSTHAVHFPYLPLLISYAIIYLVVWIWIGRRLPVAGRVRFRTLMIGAGPLFCLSFLGYAAAAGVMVLDLVTHDERFSVAGVFLWGFLATITLGSAVTSVAITYACRSAATIAK